MLLFMSGHTERHLKQIRKIMTDSSFPRRNELARRNELEPVGDSRWTLFYP